MLTGLRGFFFFGVKKLRSQGFMQLEVYLSVASVYLFTPAVEKAVSYTNIKHTDTIDNACKLFGLMLTFMCIS